MDTKYSTKTTDGIIQRYKYQWTQNTVHRQQRVPSNDTSIKGHNTEYKDNRRYHPKIQVLKDTKHSTKTTDGTIQRYKYQRTPNTVHRQQKIPSTDASTNEHNTQYKDNRLYHHRYKHQGTQNTLQRQQTVPSTDTITKEHKTQYTDNRRYHPQIQVSMNTKHSTKTNKTEN